MKNALKSTSLKIIISLNLLFLVCFTCFLGFPRHLSLLCFYYLSFSPSSFERHGEQKQWLSLLSFPPKLLFLFHNFLPTEIRERKRWWLKERGERIIILSGSPSMQNIFKKSDVVVVSGVELWTKISQNLSSIILLYKNKVWWFFNRHWKLMDLMGFSDIFSNYEWNWTL